jgi:hypothetical protein
MNGRREARLRDRGGRNLDRVAWKARTGLASLRSNALDSSGSNFLGALSLGARHMGGRMKRTVRIWLSAACLALFCPTTETMARCICDDQGPYAQPPVECAEDEDTGVCTNATVEHECTMDGGGVGSCHTSTSPALPTLNTWGLAFVAALFAVAGLSATRRHWDARHRTA